MNTPAAPLFSVIITTVDRPRLLADAVASVLGQTLTDFELIVVNDGGPDIGERIAGMDPLGRARVLALPGRSGPGKARNQGIQAARGKYVCFLDDDDLYYPEHLSTLAEALARHRRALVYADAIACREQIDADGSRHAGERINPWRHDLFIRQRLWIHNFIPVQTFAVRRDALLAVGGFDEALRAYEDWDLLLRLAVADEFVHEFIHVPRLTSEIRMRPDGGTHRSQSVRSDRSEAAIIEELYARHGDLDDPLVRVGRDYVRANHFARGPDFLIVDADPADLAYREWRARHCRDETPPAAAATASLRLVVPAPAGHARWLAATLASARALPGSVGVTVIGTETCADDTTIEYVAADPGDPATVVGAIGKCLRTAGEDWIAIVPAGTTFAPNLTALLADARQRHPRAAAIYFDHDSVLLPQGIHARPAFKPDFDPELLAGTDYIGPALCLSRARAAALGDPAPLPAETLLLDLLWRLHEQAGDDAIAHVAAPAIHLPLGWQPSPFAPLARQALLEQHLRRLGANATVLPGPLPETLRVAYAPPTPPTVSLIVWGDGDAAGALRCANGVARTGYAGALELLPACAAGAAIAAAPPPGIAVLPPVGGASTAERANAAALAATGEILVFLRDTTEIVTADWLEALTQQAARDGIGAVAPKLVGGDGCIRGGALELPPDGRPQAAHTGSRYDLAGDFGCLQLAHTVPAVSADCLALRRQAFLAAGGFGSAHLDTRAAVDLCQRLASAGLRNLWEPRAVVADHAAPT